MPTGQHFGHICKYQVIEILSDNKPVYANMQRAGEPFIDLAWACRGLVRNAFLDWLAGLAEKPETRIILGCGVPVPFPTALAAARFLRDGLPLTQQRRGTARQPVCRVRAGCVEAFDSIGDAARSILTSERDIKDRTECGHADAAAWSWWLSHRA